MHTYLSFLSFNFCYWSVLFCVSLSFSRIVCTWHPSTKLLCLGTLFIPGHLLLLILLLLTSGSIMIKPVMTFQRTSLNVAFIWNVTLFYQIFSILIYRLSFTGKDGSLFVRSQWVLPPWSYRSCTPICMVLIHLYLVSSLLFEVLVLWSFRSLSPMCYTSRGYRILITPIAIVCRLCLKTNSHLSFAKHLHLGVTAKTPLARAL